MENIVTFMSYNSTGMDSAKVKFTTDICEEFDVDFMAIQEHFKFVNSDKYFKPSFVTIQVILFLDIDHLCR